MGTALTNEQLAEVGRVASRLILALDADRSGQEAMLRAARLAEERGLDLRVVEMPEGTDPAELVSAGGAEPFLERMGRALGMIEFQVGRVLADADLDTPSGRDRALQEARTLIAAVPDRTATRDALVRQVADRLDVPADYVSAAPAARRPKGEPQSTDARRPSRRSQPSAPSCRSAWPVGSWGATTWAGSPTSISPRRPRAPRGRTWSPTSTIRSPACPRTIPRRRLWSPGSRWRPRSRARPPSRCCA